MQCVSGATGVAAGWGRLQHQRPHRHVTTNKEQKFFRGSSAMPQLASKNWRCGIVAPLPINTLEQIPMGRAWCGHARP